MISDAAGREQLAKPQTLPSSRAVAQRVVDWPRAPGAGGREITTTREGQ